MNWILPAILFFGCLLAALGIAFFMLVARCDRILEQWAELHRREEERK